MAMPNSTSLHMANDLKSSVANRKCTWASIRPGTTKRPAASTSTSADSTRPSPTSTMTPFSITIDRLSVKVIVAVSSTVAFRTTVRMPADPTVDPGCHRDPGAGDQLRSEGVPMSSRS